MPASKEELGAAMHRIYDALQFMRAPAAPGQPAELIYVGEKAMQIAWHLARAGCDVDPERAVIKRRVVPPRLGQMPGMVDWVPVTWDDPEPTEGEVVSAQGPMPDPSTFDDLVAWHTKTQMEGNFT